MNEQLEWILYRITEPHCCSNCLHLKEKTCPNENNSLKELKLCASRDKHSLFLYGSVSIGDEENG